MSVPNDRRSPARFACAAVVLLGLGSVGCKPKAHGTSPESGASATQAQPDPLAELAALEQQMQALGLPVASASLDARDGASPTGTAGADLAEGGAAEAAAGEGTPVAQDDLLEREPEAETPVEERAPSPMASDEPPRPAARSRAQQQQCTAVCDLSEAICDLELMICSLSDNHDGDPTYADACVRASDDCSVAGDACDRCG